MHKQPKRQRAGLARRRRRRRLRFCVVCIAATGSRKTSKRVAFSTSLSRKDVEAPRRWRHALRSSGSAARWTAAAVQRCRSYALCIYTAFSSV